MEMHRLVFQSAKTAAIARLINLRVFRKEINVGVAALSLANGQKIRLTAIHPAQAIRIHFVEGKAP